MGAIHVPRLRGTGDETFRDLAWRIDLSSAGYTGNLYTEVFIYRSIEMSNEEQAWGPGKARLCTVHHDNWLSKSWFIRAQVLPEDAKIRYFTYRIWITRPVA